VLNRARSEVAGSQTNVILPSAGEEDRQFVLRHSWFVHKKDCLLVTNCEQLNVGDDDEIFVKSVDRQLEGHLLETRLFASVPIYSTCLQCSESRLQTAFVWGPETVFSLSCVSGANRQRRY